MGRYTVNRMGWAPEGLNPVSEAWAMFAETAPGPALEIGAAFGDAALAALGRGAVVYANDIDARHLNAIPDHPRLHRVAGHFPRDLSFDGESLGAVLASNVFHFLTGNQLERGLEKIAQWLAPGGKLFVQAATPYQAPFADFVPEYMRRKGAAMKWPGWVDKISLYSRHRLLGQMPRSLHLLDDAVLGAAVERAGLLVEEAALYRRPGLARSLHLDGRESVRLVARRGAR